MAVEDYLTEIEKRTAVPKAEMEQAGKKYAELLGGSSTLPYKLKEALQKKLDYNKDIIQQREQVMADYFTAPARAREKYQNIWNPFVRERLVQEAKAQALQPYGVLSDVLEQRMGQVADIVGQGVAGWQGMVQTAGALADLAQKKYTNALNEYLQAAQLEDAAERRRLAEQQFAFQKERWEWEKPWQEKLWEYQLGKPYYASMAGGGGGSDYFYTSGGGTESEQLDAYATMLNQGLMDVSSVPQKIRGAVLNRALQLQAEAEQREKEEKRRQEEEKRKVAQNAWYKKFLRKVGRWIKESGELTRPHWL